MRSVNWISAPATSISAGGLSIGEYVAQELDYLVGSTHKPVDEPVDVVLYGFGRIGRLMARILIAKTDGGDSLRLRAVVVRRGKAEDDLLKRASLLRFFRARFGSMKSASRLSPTAMRSR